MIKTGNDNNSKDLYQSNIDFESYFPDNKNNYFNFASGTHRYYGVADLDKNLLVANNSRITYETRFKIFAFDFVVAQYTDLAARYVNLQQSNGYINSDKTIFNLLLNPFNIYNDPRNIFNNKMSILKENYINNFLINKMQYSNVSDFYSFLEVFNSDILKTDAKQKTLSEVILSNCYGGVNTGLGISLKKPSFSNDQEKIEFYSNNNFSFFRLLAEEYGFYIDKNNPYVLVSNITSKNTKKYLDAINPNKNYDMVDNILKDYYSIATKEDYENYKLQMHNIYNSFISIHPYVSKYDRCGKETKIFVKPITFSDISDERLLPYYFVYKAANLNKYQHYEIQKHISKIKVLARLDMDKALMYIYDTIHLWQINEHLIKKPSQKI